MAALTDSQLSLPYDQSGMQQETLRVASGQITITDLNDGKAIQAYIEASRGDTQIYNPDTATYTPDYTNNSYNQVLTTHVFVSGISADQNTAATGWEWYIDDTKVTSSNMATLGVKSGTAINTKSLTLNKNIAKNKPIMKIKSVCQVGSSSVTAIKTLNLTQSGGAVAMVVIDTPLGTVFDDSNALTQLTAVAKLMRGATHDKTFSSMKWEYFDAFAAGTTADPYWKPLAASKYKTYAHNDSTASTDQKGTSVLTVDRDDVLNFQTYRCVAVDTVESTGTYMNIVTFVDMTDPYVAEIYTLTGNTIKNGEGDTMVYVRMWRNGKIIEDTGAANFDPSKAKFIYAWTKFNKDGVGTAWSDTTGCLGGDFGNKIKHAAPLNVLEADIDEKANFYLNVLKNMTATAVSSGTTAS